MQNDDCIGDSDPLGIINMNCLSVWFHFTHTIPCFPIQGKILKIVKN